MKRLLCLACLLTLTTASAAPLPHGYPESLRQQRSLNLDWSYHRGEAAGSPERANYDASNWEAITLPHTYQLTSLNLDDSPDDKGQLTFHRDVSWYRRDLDLSPAPGQRVHLVFEGAHQKTELWVNGTPVGEHAISGFTPFHFEITDYIKPGKNTVALKLDNRKSSEIPPDGHTMDFILFGGLYRDVYLVTTDTLSITFPWEKREAGIFVTTPSVSQKSTTVSVRTTVNNAGGQPREFSVVTRILDADNRVVAKLADSATVPARSDLTVLQTGGIDENVRLWSPDDPYLYRVNTQIVENGRVIDIADTPLGLRWFEHRLGQGFLLNGVPTKLIGANRHQQYPYIGDAVSDNLHRADAIKMKAAGMNVVRLAHYPHDDAFLDACDELGILVAEEPPSWIEFGPPLWMDRLEESLRRAIRVHRNHPSLWGWGAGINHRGPVKRLHYTAKQEDPTRVTMNNGTVWSGPQHSGITDLYAVMDYREALRPDNELLFAMEHSGSVDTLGTQKLISKYKGDPNRIGTALWSAHDNYSMAKRSKHIPNLSRWSAAAWDIFRLPKPNYYWYQSELTDAPLVHIPDSRAQKEGTVTVFTNCDEIELLHDGVSLGKRRPQRTDDNAHLEAPSIAFPFDWRTGTVSVRGLRGGQIVATHTLRKPGAPSRLSLAFDLDGFEGHADGSSIVMAYARVLDESGTVIDADTPLVSFELSGPGEIVGDASIGANPVSWEHGVAPILIRVGREPGTIILRAKSAGLAGAETTLATRPWTDDVIAQNARPIYEPIRLKVDLGNPEQHVEDEWLAWNGTAQATFASSNGAAIAATLSAQGGPLEWTNAWGVPGDLSFMIEDSASVPANAAITLAFPALPKGEYTLKTWHHLQSTSRDETPPLAIAVSDSRMRNRLAHEAFLPSFGKKINVSAAGVGDKGDGGSNLGAQTFASATIHSDGSSPVAITFSTAAPQGKIALCGFELTEMLP